jgi:AsmA protein
MRLSASGFSSEKFLAGFSEKKVVKGELDFFADLTATGKNGDEIKGGLGGEVTLKGENLLLYGLDLDQLLTKIEKSRSFSLVDVGAYFFIGPFGTLFTKGYNFADIAVHAKGGQSAIRQLVSKWNLTRGVAQAADVALATNRHRLAVKGNLDFVGDRFDNITVAVLDKKGCAALTQKISGPFSKPQIEKVNVLASLVAPVFGLVKKVGKLLAGGKCRIFYTGSVKPPG